MDLQAHTMEIHRNPISENEAKAICKICNLTFSSLQKMEIDAPMIKGVNKISITPYKRYVEGVEIPPGFDFKMQINIGRILGYSGFSMVKMTSGNVFKLIKQINKVLLKLRLSVGNDNAESWYLARFDSGIDLKLCTDDAAILREYIRIFHASFNPDVRGYEYTEYKGYDKPEVQYESITIQNKSGRYNIYYKLQQLLKEYPDKVNSEIVTEIANTIRIEKQLGTIENDWSINPKGLSNALGKGNSKVLKTLLKESVTEKMMLSILQDIKLLFGKGDVVPFEEGLEIIRKCDYKEKKGMENLYCIVEQEGTYKKALEWFYRNLLSRGKTVEFHEVHKIIDVLRKKIESLGISVVASHVGYRLDGIDKLLDNEIIKNRKPRKKGRFGKITSYDQPSEKIRYQCNATLHKPDGTAYRKTLSGNVGEDYDKADFTIFTIKIKKEINDMYFTQCKTIQSKISYLSMALEDIANYKSLEHSADMLKVIEQVEKSMKQFICKLKEENHERQQ